MPSGPAGFIIVLILAFAFWWVCRWLIALLSTHPPEVDPEDVVATDQDFKCTVCNAEVTLKMVNLTSDEPPRHCREDMVPIWRP